MSREEIICILPNTFTSIFLRSLFQKEKVIKSRALYVRTRYHFYTTRVTHELTLVMCTETQECFMQYVLNHFPISTESVMGQQIFVKRSNAKVEENLFRVYSVVKCRRIDGLRGRNNEVKKCMLWDLNFLDWFL
jgi:hypothetical protein